MTTSDKGSITIEASLVFVIFVIAYLTINSIGLGIMTESLTRKALFMVGDDIRTIQQITSRMDGTDLFKTSPIEGEKYIEIILDNISKDTGQMNVEELQDQIFDLAKEDGSNIAKTAIYKSVIKSMLINNLKILKPSLDLSKLNIKNGINGLEIQDVSIDPLSNDISFNLEYEYYLDSFKIFDFTSKVNQGLQLGLFSLTNREDTRRTIWDENNFVRGRYFANLKRDQGMVDFKPGIGLDLYDEGTNTIYQIFSLNVFMDYYSKEEGGQYKVNDNFYKQVDQYKKDIQDNYGKYKDALITSADKKIEVKNPNLVVVLILPEEAGEGLIENLDLVDGVEYQYLEKAFND